MTSKIAPSEKSLLNFTESRHRIVLSFLENSLYLFPYMYKCIYLFPMTNKQILIHRCEIFGILFLGAQDVTKIDLILLKKGNKTTDIELSLKIKTLPSATPTAITMKFLTMTTMLLGDIIPSRAYLASTVITIGGIVMPSSTRRIISTSSLSREILRLLSPLYDGFGGRDDAHNSMPSNDKIATQKCEAYAALSSFHETSS
jgi:hypothetical protein